MEELNVGMIGCGLISTLHAAGYRDNPRVRLHAICDVDEQVVAARRSEWKIEKSFTDYREMLADPEAAAEWESVVELRLTPDGGVKEQTFVLQVGAGRVTLKEEPIPESAKLTIAMPAGTWAAIVMGKKSLESALFSRQLEVDGEAREGLRLRGAFHI